MRARSRFWAALQCDWNEQWWLTLHSGRLRPAVPAPCCGGHQDTSTHLQTAPCTVGLVYTALFPFGQSQAQTKHNGPGVKAEDGPS